MLLNHYILDVIYKNIDVVFVIFLFAFCNDWDDGVDVFNNMVFAHQLQLFDRISQTFASCIIEIIDGHWTDELD